MQGVVRRRYARELIVQSVLLICLLAVVFPTVFFKGEHAVASGLLFQWPPWASYKPADVEIPGNVLTFDSIGQSAKWFVLTRQAIDGGEWPLWNHYEFSGTPLLANYQSAAFYPFRLIHAFMDVYVATSIYVIMKLFLCGLTAFICGRGLGLGVGASRFLSVGWMLSMYNLSWAYWPLPDVSAWFPLVFLGVEWIIQERYRRGFCTMAVGATLLLLGGHPETGFTMGLGLGVYFSIRMVLERRWGRGLWQPACMVLAVWILALLVCSVQLLPFYEYVLNSQQISGRAERGIAEFSLPLSAFTALWVPRFFGMTAASNYWGFQNSNYVAFVYGGMPVWVGLAGLFLLGGTKKLERHRVIALVIPSVLCVVMASNLSLVAPIKGLPIFATLRHAYFMAFAVFALPILGAMGVERWFSKARKPAELARFSLIILPLVLPLATMVVFRETLQSNGMSTYVGLQIALAWAIAAVAMVLLGFHCTKTSRTILVNGLVLLLAADLIYAGHGIQPTAKREDIFAETKLTKWLADQEKPVRVKIRPHLIPPGLLAHYGIEQMGGYDALTPWRIWKFFGVGLFGGAETMEPVSTTDYYVTTPDDRGGDFLPADAEFVTELDGAAIYRSPKSFHRAFLVGWLTTVKDDMAVQVTMGSEGFNPGRMVVTDSPPPGPLPRRISDNPGAARVVRYEAQSVTVEAEATGDCVLVLADAYYPGWKAYVDGEETPIFPAYTSFRGVVLSKGRHVVEFRYEPLSFTVGLLMSMTVLLGSAAVSLVWLGRKISYRIVTRPDTLDA